MTRIISSLHFASQMLHSARNLASIHGIENLVEVNQHKICAQGKTLFTDNLQYCLAFMARDEKQFALAHVEMVEDPKNGAENIAQMLKNFPKLKDGEFHIYQVLNSGNDGESYGDSTLYGRSHTNRQRLLEVLKEEYDLHPSHHNFNLGSSRAVTCDGKGIKQFSFLKMKFPTSPKSIEI